MAQEDIQPIPAPGTNPNWLTDWRNWKKIYTRFLGIYYTSNYGSFAALLARIGTDSATIYVNSAVPITTNTTIPSNISIVVLNGGSFAISTGVTLTINGPFSAGLFQVFSGLGAVIFGRPPIVSMEWFGAQGNGSDDGLYINSAVNSLQNTGGEIRGVPGRTYSVSAGTNTIRLRSNIDFNLNRCTIQRIGSIYTANLIENYDYGYPSTDVNITVRNGFLYGNGTNSAGTQSHSSPAGNIFWFGLNGFLIENIKFDTSNGDNLGWRLSNGGHVNNCVGGSFGRNLFSPTSGINNRVTNCNFKFRGLINASPGEYIDQESDGNEGFVERSQIDYSNVQTYGVTLLDPYSNPDKVYVELGIASFSTPPAGGGTDVGKTLVGTTSGTTGRNIALDSTAMIIQVEQLTGPGFIDGEAFTTTSGSAAGTIATVGDEADQSFSHEVTFTNVHCVGNSPQTFRAMSANSVAAKRLFVGDTCTIGVEVNTAAAVKLQNVSGATINAVLVNTDPAGQGSSKAIWISGNVYAVNAASGGRFYISAITGNNVMSKTVTITNTVAAGSETVVWSSTGITIAVQAGVSTVAQVLAAIPTGTAWATLVLHTAGTVAALASTAMSALPGWTQAVVNDFHFGGRVATDQFGLGVDAIDCPITNSRFNCGHLGDIRLREGSNGNRFNTTKLGVVELTESDSNEFYGPITGGVSLNSSANNDFIAGGVTTVTIDGTASVSNRFRTGFKISGAKTFTNSATWINQIFEKEEGSFTITMPGSTSGGSTVSSAWGRYNILGDICHFSFACAFAHNNGVGNQRIQLNIYPDGMPSTALLPFDGSTPSRWTVNIMAHGFAFTGSQLVGQLSGGVGQVVVYGLANTGTLTELPANLATGTYDSVSGFFRIR